MMCSIFHVIIPDICWSTLYHRFAGKKRGLNLFNFSIYAQEKVNGSFFYFCHPLQVYSKNQIEFLIENSWRWTVPKDVRFPFFISLLENCVEKEIWNGRKITESILCINSIYGSQRQFNWCTSTYQIDICSLVKVTWNWFP